MKLELKKEVGAIVDIICQVALAISVPIRPNFMASAIDPDIVYCLAKYALV